MDRKKLIIIGKVFAILTVISYLYTLYYDCWSLERFRYCLIPIVFWFISLIIMNILEVKNEL